MKVKLFMLLLFSSVETTYEQQKQRKRFVLVSTKRTFYSAPISYYRNHCCNFQLLLSGDVELNPGPTPCTSCNKTVRVNSKRVECISCKEQQHLKCCKSLAITVRSARIPATWTCPKCLLSVLPFHQLRDFDEIDNVLDDDQFTPDTVHLLDNYRQHLSVAHLNTQSMCSSFPQFEAMLDRHQFDLITMSETWLKENKNLLNHLEIVGYKKDFRNRDEKRGGGVGFYLKSDIKYKRRDDIEALDNTIEHQWIEFTGKMKLSNTLIGILYQPSSAAPDKVEWLDKFETLLSQIKLMHHGPIIITGDVNIDLLKPTQERDTYLNILESFNLTQHVTKPTRKSKTLIDHIITNVNTKLIAKDIVYCDEISDHDAPFCIFKISKPRFEPRYKYIRDERSLVMNDFINDFQYLPFNIVYSVDDVSDKVSMLNELITSCIDRHAPVRRVKITRPSSPWMKDLQISALQRKRNHLRQSLKMNRNNDDDSKELKKVRNKLKAKIRNTKKKFLRNLLSNRNTVETWKVINNVLHPKLKKVDINPDEVNKFFNTTATRTTGKQYEELNVSHIDQFTDHPDKFQPRHATFEEVRNSIKLLRSDCSTGHDNIPTRYIKPVSEYLVSPLTHIINASIDTSTFPADWKFSRICPVPKVSNPVSLAEYRPISILPVLSKVFERIMLQQITEHIESRAIYLEMQSGFRKSHSTITLLLKLKDDIKNAMQRGEVTLAVFADFSKAFDTVDYKILLSHLSKIGFSNHLLKLISNYLSNRYQYVQVDDLSSEKLLVNFGVPQGSILGPVLFNLYVTSISTNGPSEYLLYADDTTLLRHTKVINLPATIVSMQRELDSVNQWSANSNLALNVKKTKMTMFSTQQLARVHKLSEHNTQIKSNDSTVERVETFKILGVYFNQHLFWRDHVNALTKSCFATLKSLKLFKGSASWSLRKCLAESLVLSKLNYGIILLADAPKYEIKRLQKIQNAAAGFVVKRYAGIKEVLDLKWLPIEECIQACVVKTVHKALHDKNWPSYLAMSIFEPPAISLRSNNLNVYNVDAGKSNGSFRYYGAKCFNDLPVNIKTIESTSIFKRKCYDYYFDKAIARNIDLC